MRKYLLALLVISVVAWAGLLAVQEIRLRTLDFSADFTATPRPIQSEWSFVVLPDLHNAESYLQNKAERRMTSQADRQALIERHADLYGRFARRFATDVLIVPGDLTDGEWFTEDLEKRFMPELSYTDRVRAAADIVYPSFFQAADQAGFKTVLVAPGDHEYGDDPWVPLSRRNKSVATFRDLFAQHFGDRVKLQTPGASGFSTPTGTAFEGTSHAVRVNNAVFVTVDMFTHTASLPRQALNALRGDLQTVTGTVEGAHLRWLETVLRAARSDSSIDRIFVQGHLPVLHPVRGRNTSIMYFDDGADSPFWQLLRQYEVDVYFSGEVHADTLIKDSETPLIQVTTRAGESRSMVTAVQLGPKTLTITQYGQGEDGALVETGRYMQGPQEAEETFSGILTPLDIDGPVLKYDFDQPVEGHVPNLGSFGAYYNLTCAPCALRSEGTNGTLTGGNAHVGDGYASPAFLRSLPTTVSLRFRSEDQGRSIVFSAADAGLRKGFAMFLDQGMLEMKHFHKRGRVDFDGNLADGNWHHVTLRHAQDAPLLDLDITIDGRPHRLVEWPSNEEPTWRDLILTWRRGLDSPPNHALSLGGHYSKGSNQTILEFQGDIDDFSLWGRQLTSWEIEALGQSF